MVSMVVDLWSVGRPDMAGIALACEHSGIWAGGCKVDFTPQSLPMLTLDWDGLDAPEGGPIARVVAVGEFKNPPEQLRALIRAVGLPVIEKKAHFNRLELRLVAPLLPRFELEGLRLVDRDRNDPRVVLAPKPRRMGHG